MQNNTVYSAEWLSLGRVAESGQSGRVAESAEWQSLSDRLVALFVQRQRLSFRAAQSFAQTSRFYRAELQILSYRLT